MIKGQRKHIENEIESFIQSQTFLTGIYQIERDLTKHAVARMDPYHLYLGCGMAEKPAFIFGVCNLSADEGNIIITHAFKPKSYLTGFASMVERLFPQAPVEYRRSIAQHYCKSYRRIIEQIFASCSRAEPVDLSLLSVFDEL